jgi:hypothetical protein
MRADRAGERLGSYSALLESGPPTHAPGLARICGTRAACAP